MITLDELATNDEIRAEYRKTFLLNLFQKICVRMERNPDYRKHIQTLFRETHDKQFTVKSIISKEFNYELNSEDAATMAIWFEANRLKSNHRKAIPQKTKETLYDTQEGVCLVCGEPLGNDWSKIHVDHIVPWKLVGDELHNNYQALCETCNECKSAKTDYIFRNMIKLI